MRSKYKKKNLTFVICLLLIFVVLCGCKEQKNKSNDGVGSVLIEYDSNTINSRFGCMYPDYFKDMIDLDVF